MMRLNRRTTLQLIAAGSAGGAIRLVSPAAAADRCNVPAPVTYDYRVRFVRQRAKVAFWVRAISLRDARAIVPVKLMVYNSPNASTPLLVYETEAMQSLSYIDRFSFRYQDHGVAPEAPLYLRLLLGAENLPSRLWTLAA